MSIQNKVQLITYPDSLGGNLETLAHALDTCFSGLFEGGIHILPPFPSSGDRGFAPLTYLEIDPRFGSWEHVQQIAAKHPVLLDLIVNHISARSPYFQDFLSRGSNSAYADLFLPIEKFWPSGKPDPQDMEKIFLRRKEPYSHYHVQETGEVKTLWTTFGKDNPSEQVDINIDSPIAKQLLAECLANFSQNGVQMVRLDAIGYVVKKLGTSCFFVEPDIFEFLGWIKNTAASLNIDLLPEVHSHFATQKKLADQGYWIYDFILPYRILEAFISQDSRQLKDYLSNRPHKQFTMLDCHDGIPVKPDLDGQLDVQQARKLVELCLSRGGNPSLIYSPKYHDASGFDVHQIRGTYYSLLGCDDTAYLAARAIQFFTPGIPQIYYVGLLAGKNDEDGYQKTGDGREINRHNFTMEEINREVQRPVVQKLFQLIRLRNTHPAFNGVFKIHDSSDHEVNLSWENGMDSAELAVNLAENAYTIRYTDPSSGELRILS